MPTLHRVYYRTLRLIPRLLSMSGVKVIGADVHINIYNFVDEKNVNRALAIDSPF